jgi:hypothetical protein
MVAAAVVVAAAAVVLYDYLLPAAAPSLSESCSTKRNSNKCRENFSSFADMYIPHLHTY